MTTLFRGVHLSGCLAVKTRTPALEAPAPQDERDGCFVVKVSIVFSLALLILLILVTVLLFYVGSFSFVCPSSV